MAHGAHSHRPIHLLGLQCEPASSCSREHLASGCWQSGEVGNVFHRGVWMADPPGLEGCNLAGFQSDVLPSWGHVQCSPTLVCHHHEATACHTFLVTVHKYTSFYKKRRSCPHSDKSGKGAVSSLQTLSYVARLKPVLKSGRTWNKRRGIYTLRREENRAGIIYNTCPAP